MGLSGSTCWNKLGASQSPRVKSKLHCQSPPLPCNQAQPGLVQCRNHQPRLCRPSDTLCTGTLGDESTSWTFRHIFAMEVTQHGFSFLQETAPHTYYICLNEGFDTPVVCLVWQLCSCFVLGSSLAVACVAI